VDIVKKPRFGYGKNMNPCIDCRLLMIQEAREYMEMTGADFHYNRRSAGAKADVADAGHAE
jgi:tRNA U34 2-thiouridine synthase MnmA/TrmU